MNLVPTGWKRPGISDGDGKIAGILENVVFEQQEMQIRAFLRRANPAARGRR